MSWKEIETNHLLKSKTKKRGILCQVKPDIWAIYRSDEYAYHLPMYMYQEVMFHKEYKYDIRKPTTESEEMNPFF